ncbi:MAG: APC family permease [Firmicutes bacterium]|nr:APC family permease [Bacillota bacterium]
MEGLTKKYGLFTAIAMVVGIVIGSGVFFKAEVILDKTGGDMPTGILAWIIGGVIMLACIYMFAIMATKYEKVNGIVDYAEATVGEGYAYILGWFLTMVYYPTITSVLAWLSARYTMVLFGSDAITGGTCMVLACLYLCASYAVNALSPIIAGKFQVTATVIKLIPLLLMAIIGTIVGISNGMMVSNFTTAVDMSALIEGYTPAASPLFAAVVATAFAYEGWIIATSINSELHNAKRNLPIALIAGGIIIILVYICYYLGLAGAVDKAKLIADGASGVSDAFKSIFGSAVGSLLVVFIVISCMGTLNGLMLGCVRGLYSIASRGRGPKPKLFSQLDNVSNMPTNSSIMGLLLCAAWLFYFYGANLADTPLFGVFCFDSSELPIVTLYALYIPIFVMFAVKSKESNAFNRFVAPVIAVASSVFMVIAAFYAHGVSVLYYLIIFTVIMFIGIIFAKKKQM